MQKFPKKSTFRQRDKQIWVQHDEKDIKGDFSVAIKIGSMQRPNDQLQTEILMNVLPKFLEMKKVNPDGTEVPYFNPEEVFKATMKKTGFTETEIMKMMETSVPAAPPAPPSQQGGGQGGMGGQDALANMLMQ